MQTPLNNKIETKKNDLKFLIQQENELVERILEQYSFNHSHDGKKEKFEKGIRYITRKYYEDFSLSKYDNHYVFDYNNNPIKISCCELKYIDEIVSWNAVYKYYVGNYWSNNFITSLDEYKKISNIATLQEFYGKNLVILNHKKLGIKNFVYLFGKD